MYRWRKWYFIAVFFIALITGFIVSRVIPHTEAVCFHCNILVIDFDVLRADDLPCYGYRRNTAPNLCSFAGKSALFENNYSSGTWTLPSMFSTITSLYPTFHKVRNAYTDSLASHILTLAEALKREGYETVLIEEKNNPYTFVPENGGTRGFDVIITDQSVDRLLNVLKTSKKPVFIYYYRSDMHMPYILPEGEKPMEAMKAPPLLPISETEFSRYLNTYLLNHASEVFKASTIREFSSVFTSARQQGSVALTELFYSLIERDQRQYLVNGWTPVSNAYLQSFDTHNKDDLAYIRMLYDTKIRVLDREMDKLFVFLNDRSVSDKTITVITSDHGESFGQYGTFGHINDNHSDILYAPLIIRSPGYGHERIREPSSNVDIFPTLLELTGSKPVDDLQGISLVPFMRDPQNAPPRFIISEVWNNGVVLQNKNWFYLLPSDTEGISASVLYDKIKDPTESINKAADYPDLVKTLYDQALLLRSYQSNTQTDQNIPDYVKLKLTPEKIRQMKLQGYF